MLLMKSPHMLCTKGITIEFAESVESAPNSWRLKFEMSPSVGVLFQPRRSSNPLTLFCRCVLFEPAIVGFWIFCSCSLLCTYLGFLDASVSYFSKQNKTTRSSHPVFLLMVVTQTVCNDSINKRSLLLCEKKLSHRSLSWLTNLQPTEAAGGISWLAGELVPQIPDLQ